LNNFAKISRVTIQQLNLPKINSKKIQLTDKSDKIVTYAKRSGKTCDIVAFGFYITILNYKKFMSFCSGK